MTYALINYSTGEVFSTEGRYAVQYLYNRALSIRRHNRRYDLTQDELELVLFDENRIPAKTIEKWAGGVDTPLEDLALSVRVYYTLKRRGVNTVGEAAMYALTGDIDSRLPSKAQYELARRLLCYCPEAASKLIRKLNLRRFGKG
jgi:hypothetical protein